MGDAPADERRARLPALPGAVRAWGLIRCMADGQLVIAPPMCQQNLLCSIPTSAHAVGWVVLREGLWPTRSHFVSSAADAQNGETSAAIAFDPRAAAFLENVQLSLHPSIDPSPFCHGLGR